MVDSAGSEGSPVDRMRRELVVTDLPVDDPEWARLAVAGRGATPYHLPAFVAASVQREGRRLEVLGARREGRLVGAVAVVINASGEVRPRALAAYNAPVVERSPSADPMTARRDEAVVMHALLDEVVRRHPAVWMRMVPNSFDVRGLIETGWLVKVAFTYYVDITDIEAAWRRIHENRRRLVRRAERRGFRVGEITDVTATVVERFAALHDEQHLQYPDGHTELDADGWRAALPGLVHGGTARLFVAESSAGEPAAFALMTGTEPLSVMVASGASHAHLDDGATALLRWEVMRRLSADGVGAIDLGGARPGPVGRFKASFGGDLVDRWELRSPPVVPTWWSIPRRAAGQVRHDIRTIRKRRR